MLQTLLSPTQAQKPPLQLPLDEHLQSPFCRDLGFFFGTGVTGGGGALGVTLRGSGSVTKPVNKTYEHLLDTDFICVDYAHVDV